MARSRNSLVVCALLAGACKHASDKPAGPLPPDTIPRARVEIALDGELHEPPWNERSLRAVLTDAGEEARPYSEVRLIHDDQNLYVGLYAADEDIHASDAWELHVGPRTLHLDAAGNCDQADVHTGVDRDGTIDQSDDFDEEWVVEAAIPLATVGKAPLAISARRCDTLKSGEHRCGSWQHTLALE